MAEMLPMENKIREYFEDKEALLVDYASRLIKIPSLKGTAQIGKPYGDAVHKALEEALAIAKECGFVGENLEGQVGVVDLNDKETALHILAHLDVVTPGTGWTVTEAFSPLVKDGVLYGRGASDDKGPLIAALLAMKAVKDLDIPTSKNVRLIMGTDEETGMGDIDWYYKNYPYAPHAFSPDSEFPVTNMEKGHLQPTLHQEWGNESLDCEVVYLTGSEAVNVVAPVADAMVYGLRMLDIFSLSEEVSAQTGVEFTLTDTEAGLAIYAEGKGTHASTPEEGNNALTALIALLAKSPLSEGQSANCLKALHQSFPHGEHSGSAIGIDLEDEFSSPLSCALTKMNWTSTGFTARFDARTPLSATEENTLNVAKAHFAGLNIHMDGHLVPAHYVPSDSDFVQTLLQCYERYTGEKGHCIASGGGTYVHHIPGGVAFGCTMPGYDTNLHGADEHIPLKDLMISAQMFTHVILDICTK